MPRQGLSSEDDPLVQICTNLSYSIYKRVLEEARKEGKNKTEWIRGIILDKLKIK